MKIIKAFNIDYDADGDKSIEKSLPKELVFTVEDDFNVPYDLADQISDKTGWCVNNLQWENYQNPADEVFDYLVAIDRMARSEKALSQKNKLTESQRERLTEAFARMQAEQPAEFEILLASVLEPSKVQKNEVKQRFAKLFLQKKAAAQERGTVVKEAGATRWVDAAGNTLLYKKGKDEIAVEYGNKKFPNLRTMAMISTGSVFEYTYDEKGRMSEQTEPSLNGNMGTLLKTATTYDKAGRAKFTTTTIINPAYGEVSVAGRSQSGKSAAVTKSKGIRG